MAGTNPITKILKSALKRNAKVIPNAPMESHLWLDQIRASKVIVPGMR
jgi:hypothetical protein